MENFMKKTYVFCCFCFQLNVVREKKSAGAPIQCRDKYREQKYWLLFGAQGIISAIKELEEMINFEKAIPGLKRWG
jgi:hypothetical protein